MRTECLRFGEAKSAEIDKLQTDPPTAFANKLLKKNTKTAARDNAIASSMICLGFGYADDNPQVVLASVLTLVGLGETAYAELIGADFALGSASPRTCRARPPGSIMRPTKSMPARSR